MRKAQKRKITRKKPDCEHNEASTPFPTAETLQNKQS